nr:hypothetical protein K-LCC10_0009 [Kaumoebavirus]
MKPRRIVSEEIVGILDARLPREITDEILLYVVNGRVAKAFREVVIEITTKKLTSNYNIPYLCTKTILFSCDVKKRITYCTECSGVQSFAWMANAKTLHYVPYPMCEGECKGIKLSETHRYTGEPTRTTTMIGKNTLNLKWWVGDRRYTGEIRV